MGDGGRVIGNPDGTWTIDGTTYVGQVEEAVMSKLRAVADGEKPPTRREFRTVLEAVTDGDQRDQLVAMRTRIAKALDDPNIRGADLAALTRRLLEVGKELEAIDAQQAEEDRESADATPDDDWQAV